MKNKKVRKNREKKKKYCMKYLEYFKELRNRLLICFSFIIFIFYIFFIICGQIVEILTNPLYELMSDPSNRRMIFTGLPEVLFQT